MREIKADGIKEQEEPKNQPDPIPEYKIPEEDKPEKKKKRKSTKKNKGDESVLVEDSKFNLFPN